jgi:hypothetical protein
MVAVSDLKIHQDVFFGIFGATFDVSVKITNFGKTPAISAHTTMEMIEGYAGSAEAVRELATRAKTEETYWSRIIFPDESYRRGWSLNVSRPTPPQISVSAIVIGCVTYRIWPDESVHQTGFAFSPFESAPGTNDFVDLLRITKGHIPRDSIGANTDPGGFAD